jgi:hypothetical protein
MGVAPGNASNQRKPEAPAFPQRNPAKPRDVHEVHLAMSGIQNTDSALAAVVIRLGRSARWRERDGYQMAHLLRSGQQFTSSASPAHP